MKKTSFTTRRRVLQFVLTLSLMFLFTLPVAAQNGGGFGNHHHGNDSLPPPPPPPPPHWGDLTHRRDSMPLGDTIPRWHDTLPPPPGWHDSVPPPPHRWDSIPPGDIIPRRNDTLPPPPFWGDSIRGCHRDTDGLSVARIKIQLYPNPIVNAAKLHTENATGNLIFNLYNQAGSLVMSMQNVTNGDIQVNRNGLLPGIYIYELRNSNSIVSTGTVVIQ